MTPRARVSLLVLLLTTLTAAVHAAVLHDPWLARFQVGEWRRPADVPFDHGWPGGLLEPLVLDPGWKDGAATTLAADSTGGRLGALTWGAGAVAGADRWYRAMRRQWSLLRDLDDRARPLDASFDPGDGPWTAHLRQLHASRLWETGAWDDAATAAARLVADGSRLGLGDDAVFAWALRADLLANRAGLADRPERLWRSLEKLGLYDTRSGWAIWLAIRRGRDATPVPMGQADRDTGVMLAQAGELFLSSTEFRALGLPAETESGVGALLLPKDALPAHFARYPSPPADGRMQGYWLRGKRRLGADADAVSDLARLPDLKDGHRLDLWRRASERRLLARDWEGGLAELDSALTLMDSDASSSMQDRLRDWVVQALALAVACDQRQAADRILALAERHLDDGHGVEFAEDAASLLKTLQAGTEPAPGELVGHAAHTVRHGVADSVLVREITLPDAATWRDLLYRRWAAWGLVLAANEPAGGPRGRRYVATLEQVAGAASPAWRAEVASRAVGRGLAATSAGTAVVHWAAQRDIEQASGHRAMPLTSPIPDLTRRSDVDGAPSWLARHVLLGTAILLDDDRGMIGAAVGLPEAPGEPLLRRTFLYPLPADPAVRRALAVSPAPPLLLMAIARNESLFEPAVRSRAGALGYMQVMPFHYRDPAGPPGPDHWSHPAASLEAGGRILAAELASFDGDPYRAVAAYNGGRGAVNRWQRQLGGPVDDDVFLAWIGYPETRGYTLRVLRDSLVYRRLLDGGS
jgi:soluble lytic murein transglycosylase-like protein